MPDVKKVTLANIYYLDMNTARDITNVNTVWETYKLKGEGTVVAVVDTGIDYTHKDMKLSDPSKAKLNEANVTAITGSNGKFYTNKVPYGYNFADKNFEVIPTLESTHGMHVSGIVGANGDQSEIDADSTSAIKGVAPETQLLAMKVFSGITTGGASSVDIIAAIEDSVRHKADVINMSLGSTASFASATDPQQLAIKNATDAGVTCVVSGGNSFYSTYGQSSTFSMDPDTEVVGGPGLWRDTIQVASAENTSIVGNSIDYTSTEGNNSSRSLPYTTSEVAPATILTNPSGYEIVDCAIGSPTDFDAATLTGKIALVQKISGTFSEKKGFAQAAGALGVIFYNAEDDNSLVNISAQATIKIPCINLGYSDGAFLKSLIAKDLRVIFKAGLRSATNSLKGEMSDFSSWGPTPDLAFKPEVSAPGGNIWSTSISNKYESMSGTSMAAPHTAGAMALIMQYLNSETNPLKNRELVSQGKTLLINSAQPIMDPATNGSLPYLTRKQGAGQIQIDRAIQTKAFVTDSSNSPTISLKSIEATTTFDLKITNFGTTPLTYRLLNKYGVLTTKVVDTSLLPYAMNIPGASITFADSTGAQITTITAPENATTTIKVKLNIPTSTPKDIFAEGFIKLESLNEVATSSLGIPFMGFYGSWDGPRTFDAPVWDTVNSFYKNGNLGTVVGTTAYLLNDPSHLSFSPNGDTNKDVVYPYINLMRNVKTFKVQVLDKDSKVIRDVYTTTDVKKTYFNTATGKPTLPFGNKTMAWDGKINGAIATEGDYFIRVSGLVDSGKIYSNLDMKVAVDITAPTLSITGEKVGVKNYKMTLAGSDKSDLLPYKVYLNDSNVVFKTLIATDTECEFELPINTGKVSVVATDYAGNMARKDLTIDNPVMITTTLDAGFVKLPDGLYANSSIVTFGYKIIDSLRPSLARYSVTIDALLAYDNKLVETYTKKYLTNGNHTATIEAFDATGNVIAQAQIKFKVDSVVPYLSITDPKTPDTLLSNGEKEYTMKITTSDLTGFTLYANDIQIGDVVKETLDGTQPYIYSTYIAPIPANGSKVVIRAVDKLGNTSTTTKTFTRNNAAPIIFITAPIDGSMLYGKNVTVVGNTYYKADSIIDLKINNVSVTQDSIGNFSKDIEFASYGDNKITITATAQDKVSAIPVELNVRCSSLEFAKSEYYSNGKTSIEIPYLLRDSAIDHVNVTPEGGATINNLKKESISLLTNTLKAGANKVKFEACDSLGFIISTDTITAVVAKEVLITTTMLNGFLKIDNKIYANKYDSTIGYSLVEGLKSSLDHYTVTLDAVVPVDNAKNETYTLKGLYSGKHTLTINALSNDGSIIATEIIPFKVDYSRPILMMTSPKTYDTVLAAGETKYTMDMTISDRTGFTMYINDVQQGPVIPEPEDDYVDADYEYIVDVPVGGCSVIIKCIDKVGNVETKQYNFTRAAVNEVDPVVTVTTPTEGSKLFSNNVNVTGTVTAKSGAIISVKLNDTIATVAANGQFNGTVPFAKYGKNKITVVATVDGSATTPIVINVTCSAIEFAAPIFFTTEKAPITIPYTLHDSTIHHVNVTTPGGLTVVEAKDSSVVINTEKFIIGDNNVKFDTYDKDGNIISTEEITIVVTKGTSNDASLKAITINDVLIKGFLPNVYDYTYLVPSIHDLLPQVKAMAMDATSKVDILQADIVTSKATITVTAENGTIQVYTVNFITDLVVSKITNDTYYKVGSQAKLSVSLKNQSTEKRQATLIMGLFTTDGELLCYVAISQWIESGNSIDLHGSLSITSALVGSKNCVVKYLVWDSIDGMVPLTKSGEIPVVK